MPERKKLRRFNVPGPLGVDTCRIVPCCALPQSCPIVAYRGIASHFYAPIGAGHKVFCPPMSKLLCGKDLAPGVDTSRIVPCCALPQSCPIVAYRGIASYFYAPIGAGHKMFPTLMSKLLCGKHLVTLVSYVIGNTICVAETYLIYHIMRKVT